MPDTFEPCCKTRSDTDQAVQTQKMARGLKLHIYIVEGFYYLCSENKDADQLPGFTITAYAKSEYFL